MRKILIYTLTLLSALIPLGSVLGQEPQPPNPQSTNAKWVYQAKTDKITAEITVGNDKKTYSFSGPGGAKDFDLYLGTSDSPIAKNVKLYFLELEPGEREKIDPIALVVKSTVGDNYGKIIRFGRAVGSREDGGGWVDWLSRGIDTSGRYSYTIRDENENSGYALKTITYIYLNRIKNELDEKIYNEYYLLYDYIERIHTGTNNINLRNPDSHFVGLSYEGSPEIPSSITESCSKILPNSPIDFNNPPDEIKKIFEGWNQTFVNELLFRDLKAPKLDSDILDRNQYVFNDIIPKNPNYIAFSEDRQSAVSSQLDRLYGAIDAAWNNADEEKVKAEIIKDDFLQGIADGIAGKEKVNFLMGLKADVSNFVADTMRGTHIPKIFTLNVATIYYENKALEYYKCIKNHEEYESLDNETKNAIENEITKIESSIDALEQAEEDARDQSINTYGNIIQKIIEWIESIFSAIYRPIIDWLNQVPV
jgi:hypothetical protein